MFGDVGECVVFGLGGGCLGFSRLGGHPLRCRSAPSRPLALCEGEGPSSPLHPWVPAFAGMTKEGAGMAELLPPWRASPAPSPLLPRISR